jgi:hypothetical protein
MENENITNSAQEDDNIDEFMNAPLGALLRFSNGDYAIVVPDIWLDSNNRGGLWFTNGPDFKANGKNYR